MFIVLRLFGATFGVIHSVYFDYVAGSTPTLRDHMQ